MKASHLRLFFCVENPSVHLSFVGERDEEDLLNGKIVAGDHEVGQVTEGVASFVEPGYNWPADEIDRLRQSGQIARNWKKAVRPGDSPSHADAFADELAAAAGIILEVAAGPGGGLMPHVLKRNPEASVLGNDISVDVLLLWQEFLRERALGPEVCLAAFDAREPVVRSGAISAASSWLGIGSVDEGDRAARETFRALQPGGRLFSMEFVVDPGDWSQMPADRRAVWERTAPTLTAGQRELLENAGFIVDSLETSPGRELDPEEGGLPGDAAEHGLSLHVEYEYAVARKPS